MANETNTTWTVNQEVVVKATDVIWIEVGIKGEEKNCTLLINRISFI